MTRDLDPTSAIVLAGGVGSRLRSVVSDRPKVLAAVRGRPFLAYLLDVLEEAGIRKVVLCTGYMAAQVEETFGPAFGKMRIVYSRESTPLGTGGAVRAAAARIAAESVLVMNGDSFCEVDLPAMAAAHRAREAEATILLTEIRDARRFGRVQIGDDGRVLAFEEKSARGGPGWINAGVYLLHAPAPGNDSAGPRSVVGEGSLSGLDWPRSVWSPGSRTVFGHRNARIVRRGGSFLCPGEEATMMTRYLERYLFPLLEIDEETE